MYPLYHVCIYEREPAWMNAFKNRYGFVEVDINNEFKRTPKKSAYWFKELISNKNIGLFGKINVKKIINYIITNKPKSTIIFQRKR